jgi:ABC-2 type transport system permease protein
VAGEYRHRTAVATFLVPPDRRRVVTAQVITFVIVGVCYALGCVLVNLAVAVPALHSQLATVAAMLLYLYVLEPLLSHIASLSSWTPYLPGVAADSLTQDIQDGVRLLSPWAGGLLLAAWAITFVIAGVTVTERSDLT